MAILNGPPRGQLSPRNMGWSKGARRWTYPKQPKKWHW